MAGLLSDVLPYLYSQGDRLKRHAKGLLADPAGTMAQTAGLLGDKHREQQGLMAQAFADPKAPFRVTDDGAMMQAAQAMLNGPLGMAPAGITAWHGSPHIFDKFDSSKIGTGEGAQAYGRGLYLAESPEVAKSYRSSNAVGTGKYGDGPNPQFTADLLLSKMPAEKAESTFRRIWGKDLGDGVDAAWAQATKKFGETSALYKVDLPDEAFAQMLDWDAPLSKQAEAVRAAALKIDPNLPNKSYPINGQLRSMMEQTGGEWIDALGRGHAERLRELGVPGIRYLDGGSRGAGDGTRNFVVFPGEENILKILERNGQPLR